MKPGWLRKWRQIRGFNAKIRIRFDWIAWRPRWHCYGGELVFWWLAVWFRLELEYAELSQSETP